MVEHFKSTLDKVGITLSLFCALHCFVTPFLILFLPWMDSFLGHDTFHMLMFVLVAPLAFLTLYRFRKVHLDKRPLVLGMIGVLLLFSAIVMEEFFNHDHHEHMLEKIVTIAGSLFLVLGHWLNFKKSRHTGPCHGHHKV